jgi:hypothetical protein
MGPTLPPLVAPRTTNLPQNPLLPTQNVSPNVGMAQHCLIGEVAVAWAKLEHNINDLIWTTSGKDLASGRGLTEELMITKLLAELQKASDSRLKGDKFKNERRSVMNIIKYINATKHERNLVIHGSWGEIDGTPVVGSLRTDTPDPSLMTFTHFQPDDMREVAQYAINAIKHVSFLNDRLEPLIGKSSPQPEKD